jgi:hypothetical protein
MRYLIIGGIIGTALVAGFLLYRRYTKDLDQIHLGAW